ncbi:MAG TPA: competence/damage-inducible protein A [Geobacteraceae bacterium]|nr:competence/damage-inducible protein A [Geobacteraceae bacterium]
MKIATLSIGDELLCGEVADTNAARIGERLYRRGLKVQRHMTVGDQELDIVEALLALAEKSDVVIVTGGLGPTVDDVTARAAAKATGRRLVLNEEALAHVRLFAGKLGKGFHPLNEKEALIPASATLIPNPTGTACGFHLVHNGRALFFMPGVPSEMARMLEETVLPAIEARRTEKTSLATKVLKVFGPSEAEVDELLKGVLAPDAGVTVAFGVDFPEVHVKLRAEGNTDQATEAVLKSASVAVRQKLKGHIFGEDDDTLDVVVARMLRQKGVTLSLAESCTGGLVAKRITDLPGSSDYFIEGAVTYADAAKVRILGVPPRTLEEHGAVSSETAMAMAKGVRKGSGSDLGLAITGIAGPSGGSEEKPVGTVFIALASRTGCHAKGYRFSGSRDEIRMITACMALEWLRRHLISL